MARIIQTRICYRGPIAQCLMEHEEAKKKKRKTRRLNAVVETTEHRWQIGYEEIRRIQQDIQEDKNWKYRMEAGVVTKIVGKIWISDPKEGK